MGYRMQQAQRNQLPADQRYFPASDEPLFFFSRIVRDARFDGGGRPAPTDVFRHVFRHSRYPSLVSGRHGGGIVEIRPVSCVCVLFVPDGMHGRTWLW